jgi:PAS domain S-box-containing protein
VWLLAELAQDATLRERFQACGVETSVKPAGCKVVAVDCRRPEAWERIIQLRADSATADLLLLALVEDRADAYRAALAASADGLIAADRLEVELSARLELLAQRQRERERAQRHERDLTTLLELTSDYAHSKDASASAVTHKVTRRLADELNLASCALVVLDEERSRGRIVAASDDAHLGEREVEVDLARYPELREVLRSGKPQVLSDAPKHPLLDPVREQLAGKDIGAIAALPLAVQGKVLGALLLRASARRRSFSPRDIDFASTVAHATAIALRNARLLQSAEARATALARYQGLFTAVTQGIALVGHDGQLLTLNPTGARMLGVPDDHSYSGARHLFQALTPAGEEAVQELLFGALSGRVCAEVDVPVRKADGEAATLAISAAPLPAESAPDLGGGGAAVLCFRDVTRARAMQAELRNTKEFQERLLDQAADAIIAADMRGQVVLFNQGAERICGYGADEALGRLNVRDLYPAGLARELMKKIRSSEHGGRGRLDSTRAELVTRTGERVPVSMTAALITEDLGGVLKEVGTVGIFSDLRERVNLEAQLTATQEKLVQTEKTALVAELAGSAAHELNQPLTSIMGYAEILRRRLRDEDPNTRAVDIIFREAERMADIVRKIGRITRYETKPYVGSSRIIDIDASAPNEPTVQDISVLTANNNGKGSNGDDTSTHVGADANAGNSPDVSVSASGVEPATKTAANPGNGREKA